MGKPMAKNLIKAGHTLVVHSRSRAPVDELVAAGATAGASPAEVARAATIVITMLPDTPDVELVLTGPNGVLSALQTGAVVVDMSSISPAATERLAARSPTRAASMLDAPVSGGEIGAIKRIAVDHGWRRRDGVRARQADLRGDGQRRADRPHRQIRRRPDLQVCNQIAIGGALAGVSEALALAKKANVDAARVRQALLGGFAASRVLEVHGERMLTGNYKPGFRTKLYQKDLRLANEAASANAVAIPSTAIVTQMINALVASGGGDLDYAALGTVLFELAGVAT